MYRPFPPARHTLADRGAKINAVFGEVLEGMDAAYSNASRFHPEQPFLPRRAARVDLVQALLTRAYPRQTTYFTQRERPILLDAGQDMTGVDPGRPVRLLGYYNRAPADVDRRGLVLTFHGWEGCSHSHYNMIVGSRLLSAGYDLVRLNLRDHGPGHHADPYALNKGIFLGTLIEEAAAAVHHVAEMAGDLPFFIIGPSMGGNFALRLALWHRTDPFHHLRHVVAISPAINPASATRALDANPVYLRYFRDRWLGSLYAKERLFPDLYDFSDLDARSSMYELTDQLVRKFGFFDSADAYFRTYGVTASAFEGLTVPITIITAADDAVIPVAEFYSLPSDPLLDVQIHPAGGHVGFADLFPQRHHLPDMVLEAIA